MQSFSSVATFVEVSPVRSLDETDFALLSDQWFRDGRSLASAEMYLPVCSHVWVRLQHDRSRPIRGGCTHVTTSRAPRVSAAHDPRWLLPY